MAEVEAEVVLFYRFRKNLLLLHPWFVLENTGDWNLPLLENADTENVGCQWFCHKVISSQ